MLSLARLSSELFNKLMSCVTVYLALTSHQQTIFTLYFINSYRLLDVLYYTCAHTERVIFITLVYHAALILVARPQYGTVAGWWFSSMRYHADKHLRSSIQIVSTPKHVTSTISLATFVPLKTQLFLGYRCHENQMPLGRESQKYLYMSNLNTALARRVQFAFLGVSCYLRSPQFLLTSNFSDNGLLETRCETPIRVHLCMVRHKIQKLLSTFKRHFPPVLFWNLVNCKYSVLISTWIASSAISLTFFYCECLILIWILVVIVFLLFD